MRTEKILKYLNFFPDKESLDTILRRGYHSSLTIHKFIDKLGKTSLNLNIYKNALYGNVNLLVDNIDIFKQAENQEEKSLEIEQEILKQIRNINLDKFRNNPDYLIVNIINDDKPIAEQVIYNMLFIQTIAFLSRRKLLQKILLNTYGIETVGILTLQDEVFYNGDIYILDSCILGNFNTIGKMGHAISGLTCNNNRYVYNGTFKNRGTSVNPQIIVKRSQCDLMKFPWNVREENKFCLNPIFCNLDLIEEMSLEKLCFSFNNGPRTLIYVKNKECDLIHHH